MQRDSLPLLARSVIIYISKKERHLKRIMKKLTVLLLTAVFICVLLSGCYLGGIRDAVEEAAERAEEEYSSGTYDEPDLSHDIDPYYEYESWYHREDRNSVPFSSINYERPDVDAILGDLDTANEAVKNASDQDRRDNVYMRVLDIFYDYETLINYVYIRSCIDETDSYWKDEYSFLGSRKFDITDAVTDIDELYRSLSDDSEEDDMLGEGELAEDTPDEEGDAAMKRYAELKSRESDLISEYYSMMFETTVDYNGQKVDISTAYYSGEISKEDYIKAVDKYYGEKNPVVADIYIELINIRREISEINGYDSYEMYVYDSSGSDYDYDDIVAYRECVKKYFAPDYLEATGYDLGEIYGQKCTEEDVIASLSEMASDSEVISEALTYMLEGGLYDITDSPLKTGSAFEMYLYSYDSPFILVRTQGNIIDIYDVAHEFGHFCDDYVNWEMERSENECLDMSEVFSQAMSHLVLYSVSDSVSDEAGELLSIYSYIDDYQTFVEQSYYSELESVLYATDDLTVEKVNAIAGELAEEYGITEDAHRSWDDVSWIDISHLFEQPFYTISYCTSLDAALQIDEVAFEDYYSAVKLYEDFLDRQGDGGFISNLERVGMESPFSEARIKEVHDYLASYLL